MIEDWPKDYLAYVTEVMKSIRPMIDAGWCVEPNMIPLSEWLNGKRPPESKINDNEK